MSEQNFKPTGDAGFPRPVESDAYLAGEAVLARAKSVSQRIAERVRELTRETDEPRSETPTDEHRQLGQ